MNTEETAHPCDVCGEGHLHPKTEWNLVEYKGQHGKIHHYFSVCDVCRSEVSGARQALDNKRAWIKFRKEIDGIPSGSEIAKMRKRHELTQALAGKLFGGGPVAFSKYENDDLIPDESMANLLYLAISYPDTVQRLAARKNISLPLLSHSYEKMLHWDLQEFTSNAMFSTDTNIDEIFDQESNSIFPSKTKKVLASVSLESKIGNGENGEQLWRLQ